MPEPLFLQIDRCNAGPRLTIRRGEGRQAPEVATLVRQPCFTPDQWANERAEWLGLSQCFADTPVHSWKGHALLGTVQDLIDGVISEEGDHG